MPQNENDERLETFGVNSTSIEHLHRYAITMALVKGKTVLDIACGEGYGTYFLAQNAANILGVDIDAPTIQKAKQKYQKPNIKFRTGSALCIPEKDNSFDVVASFETLEHVVEHGTMMREIKRVLKPDGMLIISTPDKRYYTDDAGIVNPYHLKELYADEFKLLLKTHFHNVLFLQQSFISGSIILPEENTQSFTLYTGDNNKLQSCLYPKPFYYIALASDSDLPMVESSLFYNEELIRKLKNEKEALKRTITYRVGNTLLHPLKLIRSVLKKANSYP